MQPSLTQQAFELHASDEVVATLRFERGTLADAQTAGEHWTFKRVGFWHPQVTVRRAGSDDDIAIFKPNWSGGGAMELTPGRPLQFGAANFWHSQWAWHEVEDQALVLFKRGSGGFLKMEGHVEIDPGASARAEVPLLVVLGWYLFILYMRDAAAAAAG